MCKLVFPSFPPHFQSFQALHHTQSPLILMIYWCDLGQGTQWLRWGLTDSLYVQPRVNLSFSWWKPFSWSNTSLSPSAADIPDEPSCIFNGVSLLWSNALLVLSNRCCCACFLLILSTGILPLCRQCAYYSVFIYEKENILEHAELLLLCVIRMLTVTAC